MAIIRTYILNAPGPGSKVVTIQMPQRARVLSAGQLGNDVLISAIVDTALPLEGRSFFMVQPEETFEDGWGAHLGTVRIQADDYFVFDTY